MEQWEMLGKMLNQVYEPPKKQDVRLVCPDCGTEYETEDGDGGCPRCHEFDEILEQVVALLNDLRPTHLEEYEIREAVEDGAWRYLKQLFERPIPPQ